MDAQALQLFSKEASLVWGEEVIPVTILWL